MRNVDVGQHKDFALEVVRKRDQGTFTYTCGWCGRLLTSEIWAREAKFKEIVGVHWNYSCVGRAGRPRLWQPKE